MALSNAERQRRFRERKKRASLRSPGAGDEATAIAPPAPVALQERDPNGRFGPPLSEEEVERWLEVIASGYTTRRAAKELLRDPQTFDNWRHRSKENEARYREAFELGTQAMEDEAARRGMDGYEVVTRNKAGEITKVVETYDSALLQLALKARRPDVYRENHGQGGGQPTVIVVHSSFSALKDRPIEVEATEVAEIEE